MKVVIIGNGGHSKVVQEMVIRQGYGVHAIVDDKYESEQIIDGIMYAPLTSIHKVLDQEMKVVVAIGSNVVRKHVVRKLKLPDERYLTVIDPTAVVSNSAAIGYGTVVMPKVVINADAHVHDHCIINTGAVIEHDNSVWDYSHISPHSTLTGNVTIDEGVHIGAGVTIIPGINIGEWSIIGAGATVIRSVPGHSKAVGTPARIINRSLGVVKDNM
ncbi:acetyltransferase [Rossellomorea vietnamensis]|uniref:Acetyltransferase n=1 Tax=Rossellomorea vietnamensis TaxID=218284 RepID=A0A6I6UMI6_9BACI|nr:acetyltransferase [Rossellomorea vietnamensis]QHE59832.1 acetyltransferase [Rossellomorea vietnamensis]